MNNILSQLSPEILKQLLMQQQGQQMPQEPAQPQQFDPNMLASLLRGKMQMPPGMPTVGIRG